jgi:hypothetical protein
MKNKLKTIGEVLYYVIPGIVTGLILSYIFCKFFQ